MCLLLFLILVIFAFSLSHPLFFLCPVFPKNQLRVLFSLLFFVFNLIVSAFMVIISFVLLALGLICSSFPSV